MLKRVFLLLAGAAALAVGSAQGAPATAPPTLTGETLIANAATPGTEVVLTELNCNALGAGTVGYRATGVAAGPYPGTFIETGTFTFGLPGSVPGVPAGPGNPITEFRAEFTIMSPVGTVTGTKTLAPTQPFAVGRCTNGVFLGAVAQATYEARVQTAAGPFADRGTTVVDLDDETAFAETFASALVAPQPIVTPPGKSGAVKPGKGCGDKNHLHERRSECKK